MQADVTRTRAERARQGGAAQGEGAARGEDGRQLADDRQQVAADRGGREEAGLVEQYQARQREGKAATAAGPPQDQEQLDQQRHGEEVGEGLAGDEVLAGQAGRPGVGALAVVWLIGWYAILGGVLAVALAFRVEKYRQPV